jgi:hypothetical protein
MSASERGMAKAGDPISARAAARLRRTAPFFARILGTKEGCIVHPKSPGTGGQWVCAHCGEAFQNNAMAFSHPKSHRLAWWTGERFEEP